MSASARCPYTLYDIYILHVPCSVSDGGQVALVSEKVGLRGRREPRGPIHILCWNNARLHCGLEGKGLPDNVPTRPVIGAVGSCGWEVGGGEGAHGVPRIYPAPKLIRLSAMTWQRLVLWYPSHQGWCRMRSKWILELEIWIQHYSQFFIDRDHIFTKYISRYLRHNI